MATNTAREQLRKPATSDLVNVTTDLSDNYDKVDAALGFRVVTSASRPSSPYQGQTIYEIDTALTRFYNGSKWFDLQERVARKSADETVNNSTTLQDDDHLTLSVDANATYLFEMMLRYQSITTADLKFQFVGPSGYSIFAYFSRLSSGAADEGADRLEMHNTGDEEVPGGIGATTKTGFHMSGTVKIAGTAGTLKLQWAQFAAVASDTQVLEGSFMKLRQIA